MSTPTPDHGEASDDTIVRAPLTDDPSGSSPRGRDPKSGSRAPKVVAIALGAVVVAGLAAYGVGYAIAGDKLPKDAVVSGVAVGGLDRQAAITELTSSLEKRAAAPIDVKIADETDEVDPADAGLSVDYAASIDAAGGGKSLDPRQIWRVLTGGSASDVVIAVDESKMSSVVAALAKEHDAAPKDAKLSFDKADVKQTKAVDGIALDTDAAAASLEDSFLTASGAVTLDAEVSAPDITDDELAAVVKDYAEPAVSGPITLTAGDAGSFEVTPAMIGSSISFAAKDGTLAPQLDTDKLYDAAGDALSAVEGKKPKNATVRLVDGKPEVVAAVDGTAVSEENLAKAVEPLLTKTGDERSASIELTGAKASFTTEDAEKLGVKEVTGQFTTEFPYANYRNVNIGRAAELINGTVLKPGDTFSLNGIVGERTAENGFTEGNIISGGKFRLELGGGVSQSATTTYNAMFFAGLKDIQHQPHTLYIDRYPPGREATVAWPTVDLKFENDTDYGVLVQASVKKATPGNQGSITVKMWSTKTYDKIESSKLAKSNFTTGRDIDDSSAGCQNMSPVQGFDVNYQRLFYQGDKVVKTQKFFWRYDPTDRVRCT